MGFRDQTPWNWRERAERAERAERDEQRGSFSSKGLSVEHARHPSFKAGRRAVERKRPIFFNIFCLV